MEGMLFGKCVLKECPGARNLPAGDTVFRFTPGQEKENEKDGGDEEDPDQSQRIGTQHIDQAGLTGVSGTDETVVPAGRGIETGEEQGITRGHDDRRAKIVGGGPKPVDGHDPGGRERNQEMVEPENPEPRVGGSHREKGREESPDAQRKSPEVEKGTGDSGAEPDGSERDEVCEVAKLQRE